MITDVNGKRLIGDGPTGREIHLIEIVKDGKKTWGLSPVGGGFDPLEVAAVCNQAALGIITKTRLDFLNQKAEQAVKSAIIKE